MRVTMLKTAARVPDLLTDLFGDMPAAERALRVAEFKAANPQLGRRVNLAAGTVLLVPQDAPPRAAPLADAKDLGQASTKSLVEATAAGVDAWMLEFKGALAAEARDLEATAATLKARELRDDSKLSEVVAAALEALKARAEDVKAGKAFMEDVVPRILKDLEEMRTRMV
jgi:hypothetical protein